MDPTKSFGGIAVCFSGGGCDFGCLLYKWSRLFVLFLILRLMMGWDRSCALMDGWMGKDDMCLSNLLTLLNVRVKTDIINQSNQSIER